MRKSLFASILFVMNLSLAAQEWMGKRLTNTSNFIDPTEVQMSGSINGVLNNSRAISEYQYIPFSFGAGQSIYSNAEKSHEILAEFAAFTQFEWNEVGGETQRNLINTDYKIAFSYIKAFRAMTLRVRFFHVSSHLGDDYIIRNGINRYTENRVNYEQLDLSIFRTFANQFRYSFGLGYVVRPNALRDPFSFWGSIDQYSIADKRSWGFCYGTNLKLVQETDFEPSYKLALGAAFKRSTGEPLRLVAEYYSGQLPYSQFEQNQIEWVGLGLYFYVQ